jgi:integrase
MRAWTFQDHRQKKKLGDKAPWSVGWYDPEGKKRSKRIGSKSNAEKFLRKIEGQLAAGTYQNHSQKSWEDFCKELQEKVTSGMEPGTRQETLSAIKHFERLAKPKKVATIKTSTIDGYKAKRRKEAGKKVGSSVSPATVNKELRHLRAILNKAHEWEYLPKMPKFVMIREPKKLPRYVTPDHFAAIYNACNVAKFPEDLPFPAGDWWQTLLAFTYMTGWRISEPLSLRREDLDLEKGVAITRAADNKGKRDDLVPLHPVVVEHLRRIASFEPVVFPWYYHRATLWAEFERIQTEAGICLDCHEKHEHTARCHVYGFHDLRRAFATVNAETLTPDALQALMRHRSYSTTQRYINMAQQLNRKVAGLHVPDVLKPKKAE